MPGFIRGSARQRGRAALSATPLFSEKNAVPLELDVDSQEEPMGQSFGTEIATTEKACRFCPNVHGSGASAPFNGPGVNGENSDSAAEVFRAHSCADTVRDERSTVFAEQSADSHAQRYTDDRFVSGPTPIQHDSYTPSLVISRNYAIVFLLLVGFIICVVYFTSRGNYYYIKLEIGGYDLD